MKKILSIVAAMALILSVAAVSVYAAEADEASAQADCPHTSGTVVKTMYYDEMQPVDDAAHGNPAFDYICCKACGAALAAPTRRFINTESHIWGPQTYGGSNHSGNYTEHYYTYRITCQVCNKVIITTGKTGCTAKRCIEPQ